MRKKRLGDLLQEQGRISQQDLENAVREQQGKATLLGELLLQRGLVPKDELAAALEEITHTKYVDCQTAPVDPAVLHLISSSDAVRCCVLPLLQEKKRLVVIMAEPQNVAAIDELRFMSGMEISPRLGFAADIKAAIARYYGTAVTEPNEGEEENLLQIEEGNASEIEFSTFDTRENDKDAIKELHAAMGNKSTPAVRLFSVLVSAAAAKGASDIHIDPQANATVLRLRVDGILRDLAKIPLQLQESLVSRIKILGGMDIAERRAPQDGRIVVRVGRNKLDLRVATLSTTYGEKVVIRLLDPRAAQLSLRDLGFSASQLDALIQILASPQCLLLVTGPTGSGKTTTLYSALNLIRSRAVNVITVEDPIEYMIEGINQVQVHNKAGRTFAKCLRSILRQDPNVIMVGEIRDTETAEIALNAGQTGHVVLSTLHTNSSIAAVTRLIDLNVSPAIIASSISAVIAQRLTRRLCACRSEVAISPEYQGRLAAAGITEFDSKVYVPVGCPACDHTGYKGRVGVYEILVFDEQIRALIRSNASPNDIRKAIRSSAIALLQDEALVKVRAGLTSLEEVFRVVPFDSAGAALCHVCNRHLAPDFLLCPYCGAERRELRPKPDMESVMEPVRTGESQ